MQALSAADVISSAIERTGLLFGPFEWEKFLKLCIVAVFTFHGGRFQALGEILSSPPLPAPPPPVIELGTG
jgi:hypothetical protein